MKNQNNDSLFTEIKQEEAANVNGGWSPNDLDLSAAYGGYSTSVGYHGFVSNYNQYPSSYYLPGGYTAYNPYFF